MLVVPSSLPLLLLLCFSSTSEGYDFFPVNLHRCQPIPANFSLCYGLGYTQMYLPNLLNHESITEILYELPLWQSLLTLGCHSNARLLLCSILAPVCLEQTPEKRSSLVSFDNSPSDDAQANAKKKFLYPCRRLCESVKESCETRMIAQFGYKWPSMIDCEQYPQGTDLCVSQASPTTSTVATTTSPSVDYCSMCQSRVNVSQLVNDYCRSSLVVRTRPIKVSSTSAKNFLFAVKDHLRYFKRTNETMPTEFPLRRCSCVKLSSPIILFISPTGDLIRFISIQHNVRALKKFRKTIVLRKPRCPQRQQRLTLF